MYKSSRFVLSAAAIAVAMMAFSGCDSKPAAPKKAGMVPDPGPGSEAVAKAVAVVKPAADLELKSPLPEPTPKPAQDENTSATAGPVRLPDGTTYVDEVVGTGAEAKNGCTATVNYTGKLLDGTQFDSSIGRAPFDVENLGNAPVIKGWNVGLVGMKEGGKRKLTIPATSAYGAKSPSPVIPPNSVLVFDVELLKVK